MKFRDRILNQLIEKYPAPNFRKEPDKLFENLIASIISQQLSIKAADTIFLRFRNIFTTYHPKLVSGSSFPTPHDILRTSDETMRAIGISFQKISYIKSVADACRSGLIDVQKMQTMSDEEIIVTLTQIRGIGKWTAEMILIFTLGRPDVFSVDDLGIRNAITKLYGMTDKKDMVKLAENWKPYRSTACWYLWKSLENK